MSIVTRFAPSPSGLLHIGGARTALFNYLYAKAKGGLFKIRIENTDSKRQSVKSINNILNSLEWLGVTTDQKIIFQNKNFDNHIKVSKLLLKKGLAYKCYLTKEQITLLKKKKRKSSSKIESEWRDKSETEHPKNKDYVIRLKIPDNETIIINDLIQGTIKVKSKEIDDFIILRSNKTPTFLLSSAVDDIEMNITDVIRGDDHLTNTFRQYYIYKFLKPQLPNFAHIPLIHNEFGKKLSKRDNVTSVEDLKSQGYLKEAVINYLLRLGWSNKNKEFFSLDEAKKVFDLKSIGKSPAIVDEKKIISLNNHYMKTLPDQKIFELLILEIKRNNFIIEKDIKSKILKLLKQLIERSNNIIDLFNKSKFIYSDEEKVIGKENNEIISNTAIYRDDIINGLSNCNWKKENLDKFIKNFVQKKEIPFSVIGKPLRLILTKSLTSPPITFVMEIMGKKEVIRRLNNMW
ncbi:glutamate--tRNA ligase [Rickettsiales bacterium]|nr:glutamate--tRNA ligase [Rickettsiales bacterium]